EERSPVLQGAAGVLPVVLDPEIFKPRRLGEPRRPEKGRVADGILREKILLDSREQVPVGLAHPERLANCGVVELNGENPDKGHPRRVFGGANRAQIANLVASVSAPAGAAEVAKVG